MPITSTPSSRVSASSAGRSCGGEARQPLLEHGWLVDLSRHQHHRGDAVDRVGVVLLEDVGQELGWSEVLDLVDDEALAPDDPTPPHVEHLDGGFQLVLGQREAVEVLGPLGDHLLFFDGLAHRGEAVPHPGRQLELEVGGRLAHLRLELAAGSGRCRRRGRSRSSSTRREYCSWSTQAGARPGAALDVVHEAGPPEPLVAGELGVAAAAHRERAQQTGRASP